jgi:hypothetical protein
VLGYAKSAGSDVNRCWVTPRALVVMLTGAALRQERW